MDCAVVVKVKVTERFKIPVNVHLDDISLTAEPAVMKLVTVMRHQRPECCARRLVFAVLFRVTLTVRAHTIKYGWFYHIC